MECTNVLTLFPWVSVISALIVLGFQTQTDLETYKMKRTNFVNCMCVVILVHTVFFFFCFVLSKPCIKQDQNKAY